MYTILRERARRYVGYGEILFCLSFFFFARSAKFRNTIVYAFRGIGSESVFSRDILIGVALSRERERGIHILGEKFSRLIMRTLVHSASIYVLECAFRVVRVMLCEVSCINSYFVNGVTLF